MHLTPTLDSPRILFNPKLQEFMNNRDNLVDPYSEKQRQSSRTYYSLNKESFTQYNKNKRNNDLQYKAYEKGLSWLRLAIYAKQKGRVTETGRFLEMFGYTKSQFLAKILENHNIDNYGKDWHIDHIWSYKHFDFGSCDCTGFRLAFHLDNLRGLSKQLNQGRSRMNKYE